MKDKLITGLKLIGLTIMAIVIGFVIVTAFQAFEPPAEPLQLEADSCVSYVSENSEVILTIQTDIVEVDQCNVITTYRIDKTDNDIYILTNMSDGTETSLLLIDDDTVVYFEELKCYLYKIEV